MRWTILCQRVFSMQKKLAGLCLQVLRAYAMWQATDMRNFASS